MAGKLYKTAVAQIDLSKLYPLTDAVSLAKKIAFAKFDETVEVTMVLGVDPRKADQLVRGTIVLPHGLGKTKRVAVIAGSPEKQREAQEAGADLVVNYRSEDVAARVRDFTSGAGVDHVVDVDFGGNLATTLACVKGNGSVAFYATKGEPSPTVPAGELMRLNLNVHGVYLPVSPHEARRRAQADILQWISTGTRLLPVAGRHALKDCAAAHEQVESGTKAGTVVVEPFGS